MAPVFTSFRQRLTSQEVGSASEPRCSSRVWGQASVLEAGGEPLSAAPQERGVCGHRCISQVQEA